MSTPIAKHTDGSNCYTVNCSRQKLNTSAPSSLEEYFNAPPAGDNQTPLVELEAKAKEISDELDDAIYDAYYGTVSGGDDAQILANSIPVDKTSSDFLKSRLIEARQRYAFEMETLKRWVMNEDSKQEKKLRRLTEIGLYKRAILLHEDNEVHVADRYTITYDNGIGAEVETAHEATIEAALTKYTEMDGRLQGYYDSKTVGILRKDNAGSDSLLLINAGEDISMYIGKKPLESDFFFGEDAAPVIHIW